MSLNATITTELLIDPEHFKRRNAWERFRLWLKPCKKVWVDVNEFKFKVTYSITKAPCIRCRYAHPIQYNCTHNKYS